MYQFKLIQAIRQFFVGEGFTDVMTPPMVESPVIEPHIQPFQIHSKQKDQLQDLYLHTSPEFWMKHLLSEGFEKIFNISYCFRDEPDSPIHRNQFLMLEWYRTNEGYEKIMSDLVELVRFCSKFLSKDSEFAVTELSVQELFKKTLDVDILELLTVDKITNYIIENHSDIPLPDSELDWDDYYHLLYLNKVETKIDEYDFLILKEYPYHLSALSKLKESDPRVCERFELYMNGVEIANCYHELIDHDEQEKRFFEFNETRKRNYGYELPYPKVLMNSLKKGIPNSSGIALGVERLLKSILKTDDIFFD